MALALLSGASAASGATPADALRKRLSATVAEGKTMFGHHDDPAYGHTWKYEAGRSDVLEASGKYPAVFSWDLGGIELSDSLNLDGVPFRLISEEAARQHERGGVNVFSWHARNPVDGNDSWTVADKTVVGRMMADPEPYREQLRKLARYLNSLTDGEGNKIPVVFRPWHEHTGGWFFWGTPNTTPEQYAFLWKEMRKVFDAEGVDNVVWAYSPDRVKDEAQYLERYPGDEYVDVVGIDIYHFNPDEEGTADYIATADRGLGIVEKVAREHGKIPAFTETGLESLPMADWYTSVLLPLLKRHEMAYVTVWRDAHDNPKHYYVPYSGHPATESFRQFTSDPKIIMAGSKAKCACGKK